MQRRFIFAIFAHVLDIITFCHSKDTNLSVKVSCQLYFMLAIN